MAEISFAYGFVASLSIGHPVDNRHLCRGCTAEGGIMKGKRVTDDEKYRLQEMPEAGSCWQRKAGEKIDRGRAHPLAAFVCCVLPLVPIVLVFLTMLIPVTLSFAIYYLAMLVAFLFMAFILLFPFIVPPLELIGITLAITSIRNRGNVALTVAAIACAVLVSLFSLYLYLVAGGPINFLEKHFYVYVYEHFGDFWRSG